MWSPRQRERSYRAGSMLIAPLRRLGRQVWPHRRRLLLVVDDAGWILDEVGEALRRHLPEHLRACTVGSDWNTARHCSIHFINRAWAWGDGLLDRVHPSNRLLGLWWHGGPDSPDPVLRNALKRLSLVHERFDRIQVTCRIGRETVRGAGVPDEKIVVLPEGVDLQVFRPAPPPAARASLRAKLGIADDAVAIGCFQKDGDGWGEGLLPKLVKGPDILADALELLHSRARIHAVLPGPARGYLTGRLQKAGVPFSAPGLVPRAELAQMYHALDIYVSPSRDEGGPAGVLEAMASGVPVVSTRSGMAPDLLADGRNGLLVDVDDAAGLADAVAQLVERADLRSEFAALAQQTIAAYDWPLVAARYARDLYAGTVPRNR